MPPTPTPTPPTSPANLTSNGVAPVDVLDFIGSLVASLAWPLAVLVILLVFRSAIVKIVDSLKERMPSIERLKTPWGEAVWTSSAVEEVASEVDTSLPGRSDAQVDDEDIAVKLTRVKPSAGVVDAFTDIEQEVLRYLSLSDAPPRVSPIHMFSRDPHVPNHLKSVIRELSQLRNAAAHGRGDIREDSALAYISTVRRVTKELKHLVDNAERNRRE